MCGRATLRALGPSEPATAMTPPLPFLASLSEAFLGRHVTPLRLSCMLAFTLILTLSPISRPVAGFLDKLRRPSRRVREIIFLLICILSTAYFILTAFLQQRDFFPKTHDEG